MISNRYLTDKVQPEDEIDVMEFISRIWLKRRTIIIMTLVGALVGIVLAFSIPKKYKANVVIAPEMQHNIGTGVSSIASIMGVSLDNSVDAINVTMFPNIVVSSPFLYSLFDLEVETKNGLQTTLSDYMKNHQKKSWMKSTIELPFRFLGWIFSLGKEKPVSEDITLDLANLPKPERQVISELGRAISVDVDKKTGIISFAVEMQDPLVAATVMNAIVENLKSYMLDYRTSKTRQDVENLTKIYDQRKEDYFAAQKAYADFVDSNKNIVSLRVQTEQVKLNNEMNLAYQIYSQVATQLEASRIKEQQSKPVFVILEPVSVPLRKFYPSKPKFMVGFAFLFFLLSSIWFMVGAEFYSNFKKSLNK